MAALEAAEEERAYRTYITDALMAAAGNTSVLPKSGMCMTYRWADVDNSREEEEQEEKLEDNRSAEEIAGGIWARMRGE